MLTYDGIKLHLKGLLITLICNSLYYNLFEKEGPSY
jgi:protein involved in sex pheromone biosynthesis